MNRNLFSKIPSPRFLWRKSEPSGRRLQVYELYVFGAHVATALEHSRKRGDWFWYAPGVNTAHRPAPLPAVKREAVRHFRQKVRFATEKWSLCDYSIARAAK